MGTVRGKIKKGIMIRFISMVFLCLVMSLSAAYAEENFECTQCCSGTGTAFHGSEELMPIYYWEESGIMISNSENKFLDNATHHYKGVQRGSREKREGYFYGKIMDPDGDIIIVKSSYTYPGHEAKFLEGTGKYKGITGSFKATRLATGKSVMPGTYQNCKKIKGTFELPPK